jgi:hypothetical protein
MQDPAKAYKFNVAITKGSIPKTTGLMHVQGLRYSDIHGELILSRGVIGDTYFLDWMKSPEYRDMLITVDDTAEFKYKGVKPVYLTFNDLDAGGESRYIFIETLRVSFTSMEVKYQEG